MPQVGGGGGGGERSWPRRVIAEEWVEVAGASGDHENLPGVQILQKKAKGVKFNGARFIACKLANGDEAGDYVRGEENVAKVEGGGRKSGGSCASDGKVLPIADDNTRWFMF